MKLRHVFLIFLIGLWMAGCDGGVILDTVVFEPAPGESQPESTDEASVESETAVEKPEPTDEPEPEPAGTEITAEPESTDLQNVEERSDDEEEAVSENEPVPTEAPEIISALPPVNPSDFPEQIVLASGSTFFTVAEATALQYGDAGGEPVQLNFGGGSAAITSLCEQIVDGAVVHLPMDESVRATCESGGAQVVEFVIGNNATAVLIHPDNDWATTMTLDELRLAFTTAETWADVNPAWPNTPIQRFLPGTDSGIFNDFINLLFAGDDSGVLGAANRNFSEDDNVLLAAVASNVDALVVVNYAFAQERGVDATAVAIDGITPGAAGYLLNSQVLVYTLDTILREKPPVAAFMNFMLVNNSQIVQDTGFILPVDDATQQANEQEWLAAVGE